MFSSKLCHPPWTFQTTILPCILGDESLFCSTAKSQSMKLWRSLCMLIRNSMVQLSSRMIHSPARSDVSVDIGVSRLRYEEHFDYSVRERFQKALRGQDADETVIAQHRPAMDYFCSQLDRDLGSEFVAGDALSIADLSFYSRQCYIFPAPARAAPR